MIIEYPSIYKKFVCIAGECPDTCCAGWEVDLDDEAYYRYQVIEGEMGDKIRNLIHREDEWTYFPLTKEGRCPFLQKSNLCEMIEKLGEESLCQTCAEYPRYFVEAGEYEQRDMSLACPEYARLFFETPLPLSFEKIEEEVQEETTEWEIDEIDESEEDFDREILTENEKTLLDKILHQRDEWIKKFQEKGSLLSSLEKCVGPISGDDENLILIVKQMEPIGPQWAAKASQIISFLSDREEKARTQVFRQNSAHEEFMAHFAVYITFRYWIDAWFENREDKNVGSLDAEYLEAEKNLLRRSVRLFEVMCILKNEEKEIQKEDWIDLAHIFSRQVEFDEENVDKLKH